MKATEAKLLSLLQKSPQFIVPIYQRTYSWTEKQCRQLWSDILRAGSNDSIGVHFIGSIVYVEQGLSQVSHQSPLLVIDGQQRLTTVALLIEALARALGDSEPLDGFSATKLRHYYLSNPLESGDRYFKLLLSQTDNASLKALIKNIEHPKEPSVRIIENFDFFIKEIGKLTNDFTAICRGLAKLVVVDIALNRDQDNPQLIFESMNSTGKELSQADLIRNFILMGLEPKLQASLYEDYWRLMEQDFGQEAYSTQFDSFMRHYLTVRTGDIPRERDIYEVFKEYARTKPVIDAGIQALVKDIRDFSRYFCAMAFGKETDKILSRAFHDLRELKVDVAYPFLLEMYQDYVQGILNAVDFASAVRLVEAYVFRRAICFIPTNSMNKTFATFNKSLKKNKYLESIRAQFILLPSYRRFPTDDEFRRDLQVRDLYNFRSRSYWLRRLENYEKKELIADDYSIEHILPQNPNLSSQWRQSLGSEWERVQKQWLHTLGNLTLTGYNSEYSDRPFSEKRDMVRGFKESPLRLNAGLGQVDTWNESAIQKRAAKLADLAVSVWASPKLEPAVLLNYQPNQVQIASLYTINDHPNLLTPGVREIFNELRREILALNECVNEEFLKFYVAYKAETNFVDIYPQKKKLKLTINLQFNEIDDPKNKCKDISEKRRNGDVQTSLESLDDLPYIMVFVRQAYERQMGDNH